MGKEHEELPPMVEWEFHVNSAFPMLGLILVITYFCHSLCHNKCRKHNSKSQHVKARYNKWTNAAWIGVICVLSCSYIVYAVEFWWLRIYPQTNSFTFCKALTPLLFLSQSLCQFIILFYFSVRLEVSFAGSVLAYKTWLLWLIRIIALSATLVPTILSLFLTYGVPFSLKTQNVVDKDAWLCRNAVTWSLFWPFTFISTGIGVMILNLLSWYMFMNRLAKFVRLRLQSDDTFVRFYSKKYMEQSRTETSYTDRSALTIGTTTAHSNTYNKSTTEKEESRTSVAGDNDRDIFRPTTPHSQASSPNYSMQFGDAVTQALDGNNNTPNRGRGNSKMRMSVARIKRHQERKKKKQARREKQQLVIYELIKKQTILSGIVAITDGLTWVPTIVVDGSTLILLNTMIGLTCVYLSFNFSKPFFDFCCKRFMDNCTCIEDRLEKKLAKEMGLNIHKNEENVDHHNNEHENHNGHNGHDENEETLNDPNDHTLREEEEPDDDDDDELEFKDENDIELEDIAISPKPRNSGNKNERIMRAITQFDVHKNEHMHGVKTHTELEEDDEVDDEDVLEDYDDFDIEVETLQNMDKDTRNYKTLQAKSHHVVESTLGFDAGDVLDEYTNAVLDPEEEEEIVFKKESDDDGDNRKDTESV